MNPPRCVYEVDTAKRLGVTVSAAMSQEYVAEVVRGLLKLER